MDDTDASVPQDVHSNERYAVLSHGIQEDPIYNYFNKAALLQFEFPESRVYQLPSRYSAPTGKVRNERAVLMKSIEQQDVRMLQNAIRQQESGTLFQIEAVILWNVYDDNGERVGQTAIFDRTKVAPVQEANNQ